MSAIQVFKASFAVEECLGEIRECLEKGWTGMGFKTVEFEERWKSYTGVPFAHYLNSATAGLYLAVEILKDRYGWEDGSEIITTPLTFVSTNHAIIKNGLRPIFADVDETFCLDPQSIRDHLSAKTKAVMFVGIGGNTGHILEVAQICREFGLQLILDAAHMSGTRLNGLCPSHLADVSVFSYQAVKNLPTADSGMICFQNGELDAIARKRAWLGISKDTYDRSGNEGSYKWRYDVEVTGDKYHGNSIMAAIALVQLKYLDRDNAYRARLAQWYAQKLAPYSNQIERPIFPEGCESSNHLFQILVNDRDGLLNHLYDCDIYPGVHYVDNTEYPMYSYANGTCPKAANVSARTISLPMHMGISKKEVDYIADSIIEFIVK